MATDPDPSDAHRTQALEAEHAELERLLGEELARPRPDSERVAQLKRAKLEIRDRQYHLAAAAGRPSGHAAA